MSTRTELMMNLVISSAYIAAAICVLRAIMVMAHGGAQ